MGLLFNHSFYRDARRELRRGHTSAEKLFWNGVRADQLGVHFRRQYSVEKYILDFYCPKLKLAIELDGAVHFSRQAKDYDRERSDYLRGYGIEIIRFTNDEIFTDLDRVIEHVRDVLQRRKKILKPNPSPRPSP